MDGEFRDRVGEVAEGVLRLLAAEEGGRPWPAIETLLERAVPPTRFEEETHQPPVPIRRYQFLTSFCRDRAARAGWVSESAGGVWTITRAGRSALHKAQNASELGAELDRRYHEWRRTADTIDFFISFTEADKRWADWIAWCLDREGYSILYQPWDFIPGTNFVLEMDRATRVSTRVLSVLSAEYLNSAFAASEWATALASDASGRTRPLIPIRVEDCQRRGSLFGQLVYIDLAGVEDEGLARQRLLQGLATWPPSERPSYPAGETEVTYPAVVGLEQEAVDSTADRRLPPAGLRFCRSPSFTSPVLAGLRIYPDNPFKLDFLLLLGDARLRSGDLQQLAERLVKYFLASVTIPEREQWVNLSPYEPEKVIPDQLAGTVLGRDLLLQDYVIKQLSASLCYPERGTGQEYWEMVYRESSDLDLETFNKVWAVPGWANLTERGDTATISRSRLFAMSEADYAALVSFGPKAHQAETNDTAEASSRAFKEVLLPYIENELNDGSNFALLRQIFSAMVLATWYKERIRATPLGRKYVDESVTPGVDEPSANHTQDTYEHYMSAFRTGVFKYIREEYDATLGFVVPRKYHSGGFAKERTARVTEVSTGEPFESLGESDRGEQYWVRVELTPSFDSASGGSPSAADVDTGGIDLDPGRGFELRVERAENESPVAYTERALRTLGEAVLSGIAPKVKSIDEFTQT